MNKIYFDGCCAPKNPGHGGAGWAIYTKAKAIGGNIYLGKNRTNNEAEYAALIYSLRHGIKIGIHKEKVEIYGDSQLIIKQVTKEWQNNTPHLQRLMRIVDELLGSYIDYALYWIPREKNQQADLMSVEALKKEGIHVRR